jgi:hypothetical protein
MQHLNFNDRTVVASDNLCFVGNRLLLITLNWTKPVLVNYERSSDSHLLLGRVYSR